MDCRTSEVIEIPGFKITETSHLCDGQVVRHHYNIRNQEGEVVSRDYENFGEPVELLRDPARYLAERTGQQ
jgi:hypothetical protein